MRVIDFLLRRDSTTLELTSRHRIDDVIWDADEQTIAVFVEITDPATSRPIDVAAASTSYPNANRNHADGHDSSGRCSATAKACACTAHTSVWWPMRTERAPSPPGIGD